MASKTIKISEENYKRLLEIATELQKIRGQKISFDDAICNLANEKKTKEFSIMDSAGVWSDMSDEEAKEFLDSTYKERKLKSRRFD